MKFTGALFLFENQAHRWAVSIQPIGPQWSIRVQRDEDEPRYWTCEGASPSRKTALEAIRWHQEAKP